MAGSRARTTSFVWTLSAATALLGGAALAQDGPILLEPLTVTGCGCAVLAVLHDLALAPHFADWLVVLQEGRIAAAGPAAEALTPSLAERVFDVRLRWLDDGWPVPVLA